jgi:hypothetical protein
MNYRNFLVICRNTVVLRSMVGRERRVQDGIAPQLLDPCCRCYCTTAHRATPRCATPCCCLCCQHQRHPLLLLLPPGLPPDGKVGGGGGIGRRPPSARTNRRRQTACLKVVVAGMDRHICCTPFVCAIPRSKAAKASFLLGSTSFGPPREADATPSPPNYRVRRRGWAGDIANEGRSTRGRVGVGAPMPGGL